MADVQSNIHVNIDTSDALASLKLLQRQISAFHTQMSKSGTAAAAVSANQAQNLMNSINAAGQFQASMRTVTSSTESFTNALEKNKLTSREYFRYTGAATKTFGRLFKSEFETINKVARERVKDLQTQYIKMGRGANGAMQAIAVRPLTLDMKNLGTQTAIAAQRQQLLNQLLKQGSTNLLNFGKNTQWAGRQLMVGFTVPLLMLGTQAAKTFMALEEQAIRFKRVYGEMFTTAEETDAMVKNIQTLAREYTKYGVAVEDTMKMAADAAAMGKQGAALMAQVAQATRLAVLGGVEQEQALETTISVTNAFGVATEDLAKKIDFLNAVENQTVVSIEDLTIAIPKAGPVVKQLGGDVEDLAFFLTAMKEGGINASEGANALKSGLASLINPSAKASAFLGDLGVNIKGIVEANKGDIKATVVGFAQALDTLDPLNRARAIEQLFGKFQFSRLSTLFQNVTAQGTQANRVLQLTQSTTEELAILSQRELDKIQDTTTYKFKKSMEDLKVSLAPVGEQFLKALTPIVEFVGKILEKFNGLGEGSKKFITMLTIALGAVGPLALMSFGLLANGLANIIKLFAGLKSVFNRAGSSTQVLGQQTSYLTQEQLEASAVAASLDQVHQRLRQTFTSEATAVNTLASAYRNAIAAQLGFTGPVRGGKPVVTQAGKKYSTGTTRVPGTGNKDTVPSVLTPGEAVIPADVAQDPQFKPIIHAMVNRRLKGFNGGTTYASQSEQATEKLQFAHATAKTVIDLDNVPDEFRDTATDLKARGLSQANSYSGLGFDIPEKLHGELRENRASLDQYLEEIKKPRAIQTMTENLMKKNPALTATEAAKVTDKIRRELISSLELIPRVPTADGFKPHLIGDDLVASRVGDLKSGIVGSLVEDRKYSDSVKRVFAAAGIGGFGSPKIVYGEKATPAELLKAVKATGQQSIVTAVQRLVDNYPKAEVFVNRDAKGNIVEFSRPEVGETYRPDENPPYRIKTSRNNGVLNDKGKFTTGRASGAAGGVKVRGTAPKKIRQAVERALFGLTPAELKGKEITTYANQIAEGTGFSNVAAKHLSGLHETHDGKKVFVKPMMDLRSALAEQRATQIAREVHGLDAPNQQLRIIQDPTTGKTMYALESPYDAKFNPNSMENKFDKDQYIRQNVAASLRADMDLGRGNLSGNVLADVGPAGVFSRASGERDFAFGLDENGKKIVNLPSMEEQAIKNLDLNEKVPNRKKFFAEATLDIIKDMTPEEYEKAMKDEIRRVLPKLKETVANFKDLDADEKRVYKAMIKRLEDGLKADWKGVHARAVAPVQDLKNKVAVAKDEAVQEEKSQKLTKPKMEPLPGNVKSDAGPRDTMMIDKPKKGSRVVNMPKKPRKSRRVGKFTIPGQADAPMAETTVSMPGSSRKLSELTSAYVKGAIADIKTAEAAGKQIGTTIANASAEETKIVSKKRTKSKGRATRVAGAAPIGPAVYPGSDALLPNGTPAHLPLVSRPEAAPVAPGPKGRVRKYVAARAEKRAERVRSGKSGMGMTGALGVASGAAMIGSMVPGQVGEISQKIMMPLMGLSMVLPMLKSPMGALAVGLAATVGSMVALRMAFDGAQKKVLEESEKFKGSASAIQAIAKFSGKVTASEQMDLKRKNSFSMLGPATGKTTYGEAFVQTAEGKSLTKKIAEQSAAGKGNVAAKDLTGQLSASIMSGAMDMNQAKSLAMNAARQAGDMSIGIKVIGELESLLGPDGENLVKDPLNVRLNMIAENSKNIKSSMESVNKANPITKLAGNKNVQIAGVGASALGGAAAGAGIGGMVGGPIGAAIGAGIGAIAGSALAYFASKKYVKEAATLGAAAAVDAKIAMEQNKQMLDSFDMFYQKKIDELKLQGKINEAEKLQGKYIEERNVLTDAQGALQTDIVDQYNNSSGLQEAMMSGMKKATAARYKDDPNQLAYVDVVDQQATNLKDKGLITGGQEYLIQTKMASGDLPPSVSRSLLGLATDNEAIAPKIMEIITKFTGATAESIGVAAQNILGADDVIDKTVQTQFITRVEAFEKDSDALDFTKNIIKLNNLNAVIPSAVMVSYYTDPKNQAAYDNLNKMLDAIEGKKDLTATFVYEIMPEVKGTAAFDEAYFNSLDPDQRKVYTTTIASLINIPEPEIIESEDFKAWRKEAGPKGGANVTGSKSFIVQKYIEAQGNKAVTDGVKIDVAAPATGKDTGNGGKTDSSPLDELVKKLRDVRKNQIKITEGWGASQKALNKLFGGSKTIEIFSGIENDMRKLGAGEDLIDLITGMDAKEYEDRKESLFEFDKKGNIIKLKDNARSIGDAIASISLGEFVSEQERMSKQIGNQTTALTRLKAAGIEGSVALEAVADATFAAAIANKNLSDKQIKQIAKTWQEATKNKKNYAAVQTIEAEKTSLEERAKLLATMTSIMSRFNEAEVDAILSNDALASSLANLKSLSPNDETYKSFLALLEKVLNKNKIELKIKALSLEGLQKTFDDGFSAAMDNLDVKEKTLQLDFDFETRGMQDKIDAAQDLVAGYQYKIDDQEALLRGIEKQEQKINDKYDERIEALDQVEKANAAISAQQKGQLSLAEALTSGDIAAAARAAQDMRAQAAADAVTKEKEALNKSREYELSKVRQDGKSREDVEKEIERLQDLVFAQEEKIEFDQELIRQKEVALREAIKPLDIERARWERMQNDIDIARTTNAKFLKIMADAEAVVAKLIARYNALKPDTDPIIPAGTLVCPAGTKDDGNGNCVPTAVADPKGDCPPGYFLNAEGKCYKSEKAEEKPPEAPDLTYCPSLGRQVPTSGFPGNCPGSGSTAPVKKGTVTDPEPAKPGTVTPFGEAQKQDPFYNNSLLHREDLDRIAQDAKKNLMLFEQNMNVRDVAKNAGNTPAQHLADLYKLQNDLAVQKAMAPTAGMLAQEKAVKEAAARAAADKKAKDEANLKKFGGNASAANAFGNWGNWSMGGLIPKFFALGGFAKGTDTVPAMLTPGEFIMSKYAVDSYGVDTMRKINKGDSVGGSVYNNTYALTVNAKTDANPNDIAQAVMSTIKRVDERRIRGVSLNGR